MKFLSVVLVVLLCSMACAASDAACLNYSGISEISGIVKVKMFYGEPGFGENPASDAKEPQEILVLDHAVCIDQGRDKYLEEPESNQQEVTLILNSIRLSKIEGRRVSVRGVVVHGNTWHHHTKLMIEVTGESNVKVLK
jgi:hypothetical protein